jgi:hypothetical protein
MGRSRSPLRSSERLAARDGEHDFVQQGEASAPIHPRASRLCVAASEVTSMSANSFPRAGLLGSAAAAKSPSTIFQVALRAQQQPAPTRPRHSSSAPAREPSVALGLLCRHLISAAACALRAAHRVAARDESGMRTGPRVAAWTLADETQPCEAVQILRREVADRRARVRVGLGPAFRSNAARPRGRRRAVICVQPNTTAVPEL